MLRPDFLGNWQLRADSRRIPSEQIKFFKNEDGFFANTRRLTFSGTSTFSERIAEGRINLFEETAYDPLVYRRGYRYSNRQPVVEQRMYYNKGLGDLKKVSYSNLKNDMADRAESMNLLDSYRKSMKTSTMLYTAAGLSVAAGMISFLAKGSSNQSLSRGDGFGASRPGGKGPNFTTSFLLLGLGAGFAVGGFSTHASGSRHLENAVDAYNR